MFHHRTRFQESSCQAKDYIFHKSTETSPRDSANTCCVGVCAQKYWTHFRIDFNNVTKDHKVEELFDSNPELANAVYEALGFKTTTENTSQIYSKLGNKTKSENVVIKSWGELKKVKEAITSNHIVSTRIQGTNKHFGNPFSHEFSGKLIKTETVKEAVERFTDWVINSNEGRAEWIREQLKSGKLKGKPILYYKELGEPSHATALDYLINTYNWNTQITPQQKQQAQQQYSQYLESLNKPNTNPILQGNQNITQDDKSYYRGQIEQPTIDKNGNLVLYAREDELYKRAGLKSKGDRKSVV